MLLILATVGLSGLAACNSSGRSGAETAEASKPAQTQEESTPAEATELTPADKIGRVTTVTGTPLPGAMGVDYSSSSYAAPVFVWKDGAGRTGSLADYRGSVVLVNFWGTWCGPCRRELPDIVRLRDDLAPEGFEVIGVSVGERPPAGKSVEEHMADFAEANDLRYPLLLANSDVVRYYGGIRGVPTTFIVDRDGNVSSVLVGMTTEAGFRRAVEAAM